MTTSKSMTSTNLQQHSAAMDRRTRIDREVVVVWAEIAAVLGLSPFCYMLRHLSMFADVRREAERRVDFDLSSREAGSV